MPTEHSEHDKRRQLLQQLHDRVVDILPDNPDEAASILGNLALKLLAEHHIPKLSLADKNKIKDNYPDASPDLIAERAMNQTGVVMAVALATQIARIAVDYSPASHQKALMDSDDPFVDTVGPAIARQIEAAWTKATAEGMSDFGVACTAILVSTTAAVQHGVPTLMLIRPLLDAMEIAMRGGGGPVDKNIEEAAIKELMALMRVSRATAKKYVAEAKRMEGRSRH